MRAPNATASLAALALLLSVGCVGPLTRDPSPATPSATPSAEPAAPSPRPPAPVRETPPRVERTPIERSTPPTEKATPVAVPPDVEPPPEAPPMRPETAPAVDPVPPVEPSPAATRESGPGGEPEKPPPPVTLSADQWLVRARRAYREGRSEDARRDAARAAEAAPETAEAHRLEGQSCVRLARAARRAGDTAAADLHLLDAVLALRRADTLEPGDPVTVRALADAHRDQENVLAAARAYGDLTGLDPDDADARYWHAEMLRRSGAFADALWGFDAAIEALGPEPRLVVGAARAEHSTGRVEAALRRLARAYAAVIQSGEEATGTPLLEELWRLTVQRGDVAGGERMFRELTNRHPLAHSPAFMLGSLLAYLGRPDDAAEALTLAVSNGAGVQAQAALVRALLAAGRLTDARDRALEMIEESGRAPGTASAVVAVARAQFAADDPQGAADLVERAVRMRPSHAGLARLQGDLAFGGGGFRAAAAAYRRALEAESGDGATRARLHRAALASFRSSGAADAGPLPAAAAADSTDGRAPDRSLIDFERPQVYVRALRGTELAGDGRLEDGTLVVPPGEGGPPGVRIDLVPEVDGRAYRALTLRVRVAGGGAGLSCEVFDGFDAPDLARARSRWPGDDGQEPIGPVWRTVEIPLAGIVNRSTSRPIPPLLSRLRTFLLRTSVADRTLHVDDVRLVADDPQGGTLLADFDDVLAEVRLRFEGGAAPELPTLHTPAEVAAYEPPGSTAYARNVLGDAFDAAFVGQGAVSLRAQHGPRSAGTSRVRIGFAPSLDLSDAAALTFLARGHTGGERLRVRLEDDTDALSQSPAGGYVLPARFPRTLTEDGSLELTTGWRRFRIPCGAFSDVDFARFRALVFELGAGVSNPPGTRVYLDEIGVELSTR